MITTCKLLLRVCLTLVTIGWVASTCVGNELKIDNEPVQHAHYDKKGEATADNDQDPNKGHFAKEGDPHFEAFQPQSQGQLWRFDRADVRAAYRAQVQRFLDNTPGSQATIVEGDAGDPTYEYNCHGYTFSQTEGADYKCYITRLGASVILFKGHYVKIPKKFSHHWKPCDVVVYYGRKHPKLEHTIKHTGHVKEVDKGKIKKMVSKTGSGVLLEHTPEDPTLAKYWRNGYWEVRRKCGMCINEYKCVGLGKYHVNEQVKVLKVTGAANVNEGDILEDCTIVQVELGSSVRVAPVGGGKLGSASGSIYDCPGEYTAYIDIIHGSYTIEEYGTCDTTEHCGGYTPLAEFWVDITPDTFITTVEATHDSIENYTTIYNSYESPHDIVYSPRVGPDSGDCFALSPGWTVEINSSGVVPCADPNDNGICDTLYKEVFPGDEVFDYPGPHFVRVPLYVSHDVPDPAIDSIAGFTIPLCFTHTNTSKYCSLSAYWNNTDLYLLPPDDPSIFRHLVSGNDTTHNWMMDLSERMDGSEWDTRILNLDGTSHFWLGLFASGIQDQRFEEGSRVLLATMTFKLEDTTTICIDSCFWPPNSRLAFARSDMETYVPRHFFPQCEAITPPICGDCTEDGIVTASDVVYLISYLFRSGPAPEPLCIGDVTCDGSVAAGDIVYLISYLFRSGPAPSPDCCALGAQGKKRR